MIDQEKIESLRGVLARQFSQQADIGRIGDVLLASELLPDEDEKRPRASFLLEGPRSLGMEFAVRTMAQHFEIPVVRAEGRISLAQIIGNPPGLIERDPPVLQKVQGSKQGILLIEAPEQLGGPETRIVANMLEGHPVLLAATGEEVDLRDWIVVLETNHPEQVRPELVNRVDTIVEFTPAKPAP